MSEYGINDKHDKGEDVSRLPDLGSSAPQEESSGSWGTIIFIGALVLINLLSWIFGWNFWLY